MSADDLRKLAAEWEDRVRLNRQVAETLADCMAHLGLPLGVESIRNLPLPGNEA